MRRWALLALSLCIASAGACSSFSADSPAGGGDAGSGDGGDGTPDGGGGTPDGGDADAGWTPCRDRPADPAHFCDDFDEPGTIGFKWSKDVRTGGVLGETDAAVSAPRALVTGVVAGTGTRSAVLRISPGAVVDIATKSTIRVAFSFRVSKPPYPATSTSGFTQVASLEFDDPSCATSGSNMQRQVEISFDTDGTFYVRGKGLKDLCPTPGDTIPVTIPLPLASFVSDHDYHRMTVEIARKPCNGQGTASLKLAVEGASDITCVSLGTGDPLAHATAFAFELGTYASSSNGDYADTEVAYDNVTVDIE
jgi:hypothetical protein